MLNTWLCLQLFREEINIGPAQKLTMLPPNEHFSERMEKGNSHLYPSEFLHSELKCLAKSKKILILNINKIWKLSGKYQWLLCEMQWARFTEAHENLFMVSFHWASLRFHFQIWGFRLILKNCFWKQASYILGTNPSNWTWKINDDRIPD